MEGGVVLILLVLILFLSIVVILLSLDLDDGTTISFSGHDNNHLLKCSRQVLVEPAGYCLPPILLGFGNKSISRFSGKPIVRHTK